MNALRDLNEVMHTYPAVAAHTCASFVLCIECFYELASEHVPIQFFFLFPHKPNELDEEGAPSGKSHFTLCIKFPRM